MTTNKHTFVYCITCAKRETCASDCGKMFGYCKTDYVPDEEALFRAKAIQMIDALIECVVGCGGCYGDLFDEGAVLSNWADEDLEDLGLDWLLDIRDEDEEDEEEAD